MAVRGDGGADNYPKYQQSESLHWVIAVEEPREHDGHRLVRDDVGIAGHGLCLQRRGFRWFREQFPESSSRAEMRKLRAPSTWNTWCWQSLTDCLSFTSQGFAGMSRVAQKAHLASRVIKVDDPTLTKSAAIKARALAFESKWTESWMGV
ncbi:hypothetical protein PF005_g26970 [Phytophthora fragariae]|uniref:Uncharacterized protein n=1 Tax=Phytophthora fragariae TaxID=53985 RepID=A0A6A3QWG5_9STRA|nr:hypothetical protein PF009_g4526 [Phytophthora fragariae]KAE8971791.1 hypothetical protein PF011_g25902 [Phytophthora fragariae]KAE9069887.1 hypothetical protein PF010_g26499 [Phytophthora fragariae]KAE9070474.1 hypothetical protein PF007_g26927 [Phytophthora fragariae]KAE9084666.1 hypothetical protein PF006_g26427 [Phytophthora fragariae]